MNISRERLRSVGREVGIGLLVLAVYVVAGRECLRLAVVHPSASAVWAPTGIAIGALVVGGMRYWAAVFVGAFIVNVTTGSPAAVASGIAVGNTLEAVVATFLVGRWAGGREVFDRASRVLRYSAIVAGATSIAAVIGVTSLAAGGRAAWSAFLPIATTWWLGDLSGALLVAPVFVLFLGRRPPWRGRGHGIEFAVIMASVVLVSYSLFGPGSPVAERRLPVQYVILPVCLWAALRLGRRGGAAACLLAAAIAVWGTYQGRGVFAARSLGESLLLLQAYLTVIAVTTLVVAALVAERAEVSLVRDQFLSIAGHELRNPLGALVLQVENLQRATKAPDALEAVGRLVAPIRRSSARLASLVDELLSANRIASGKWPVRAEPLELSRFARETTAEFVEREGLPPGWATIRAGGPVWCRTDGERLEYVLQNLLSNAARYGLGKPVEIGVDRRGRFARVAVRDHGPGIPLEDQERIFRRFERASARRGGFGLGLWIARETVVALGGRIRLQSHVGEGAEFEIELPVDREKEPG